MKFTVDIARWMSFLTKEMPVAEMTPEEMSSDEFDPSILPKTVIIPMETLPNCSKGDKVEMEVEGFIFWGNVCDVLIPPKDTEGVEDHIKVFDEAARPTGNPKFDEEIAKGYEDAKMEWLHDYSVVVEDIRYKG